MKNIAERKRHSFVLIEVIIAITLLAALVVNYAPKVTDVFDKPKDLQVDVDLQRYEAAAMYLIKTDEPFKEGTINKCVEGRLQFNNSLSSQSNPHGSNYKLEVIDEDNFKVISEKVKDGKRLEDKVLIISRDNGKLKARYETKIPEETPVTPPTVNVDDYYNYVPITGGYDIGLKLDFYNAIENGTSYQEWDPGEPLPNPGSKYNGQPVVAMEGIFRYIETPHLDLSLWDTRNVKSMRLMFSSAKVDSIDLSSFDTSNVTDMYYMFAYIDTGTMEVLDISNFDFSKVEDIEGMFSYSYFGKIMFPKKMYIPKIRSLQWVFAGLEGNELDVSMFDTRRITDMSYVFFEFKVPKLDVSMWDTSSVTTMDCMFYYTKTKDLNVSGLDTGNVTDMGGMFMGTDALELALDSFDTSNVTDMSGMFDSSHTPILDLSSFDTRNVDKASSMFENTSAENIILGTLDLRKVKDLSRLFAYSTTTSVDATRIYTRDIENASEMFAYSEIQVLDLINFNTSNLRNMRRMFSSSGATAINVKTFDTTNVTDMRETFMGTLVSELDLSSFTFNNVDYSSQMLRYASATVGYARTTGEEEWLNDIPYKPSGLTFEAKF